MSYPPSNTSQVPNEGNSRLNLMSSIGFDWIKCSIASFTSCRCATTRPNYFTLTTSHNSFYSWRWLKACRMTVRCSRNCRTLSRLSSTIRVHLTAQGRESDSSNICSNTQARKWTNLESLVFTASLWVSKTKRMHKTSTFSKTRKSWTN